MTYKAPSLAELQAQCDAFNAAHAVGGRVAVNLDGKDTPLITTTRSEAQILSGHSAVVWMDGVSGCYDLSRVAPIPDPKRTEMDLWTALARERAQRAIDALDGMGFTYDEEIGWLSPRQAWAVLADSGNVIYWDHDRDKVSEVAKQYRRPYGPYKPAPRGFSAQEGGAEVARAVADEVIHHIDTMYPAMWGVVPKAARTSVRNTIINQGNRYVSKVAAALAQAAKEGGDNA